MASVGINSSASGFEQRAAVDHPHTALFLLVHRMQTLTFPTEGPSSFELPEAGVLELAFAANRPVAGPAWKEGHFRAALQKARQRLKNAAKTFWLLFGISRERWVEQPASRKSTPKGSFRKGDANRAMGPRDHHNTLVSSVLDTV